jgi:chromosome segregation ATPase
MPISSIVEAALAPSQLLGELFVQKGLITHEELELALEEQKVDGKRLGEILVKKGFVSGPALTTVLAEQLGVEMETQDGFGSGLWSEIKRRHLRGRAGDEEGLELEAEEPESPDEPRLAVIDGLFEDFEQREAELPPGATDVLDRELQSLRQQVSFSAERLDEERTAHEGTQRLLDDARAEAEAHSREAKEWHERAVRAEDAGQESQTARTDLAELDAVVTDLRVELAARDEALQQANDAQSELAGDLARLQAELADLHDGRAKADDQLNVLTQQLEDERVGHAETRELVAGARSEADALATAVAEFRAELAAREEALERETETEAEREAELARLQAELADLRAGRAKADDQLNVLTQQLEDESAGRARTQELLAELRAELAAREEALRRDTEAEAEREAELAQLQAKRSKLTKKLEDERAARQAAQRTMEMSRTEATGLAGVVAELRMELADREEALRRDTEAEAELEAELARFQRDASALTKQLEDERAAHEAVQRLVEESRNEAVELDEAVTGLRSELVRREAIAVDHAEQLASLRDELAARDAARDREADARVSSEAELAQLRAEALVLHQRLDDERAENVASRREVGRLESQLSEIGLVSDLLAEAERELAARTDELAELALELDHVRGQLAERDVVLPVDEIVAGHIVFRPGASGYELAERPGPAPKVGMVEDIDGERFFVTRTGRSPLPADARRCAYLEAA